MFTSTLLVLAFCALIIPIWSHHAECEPCYCFPQQGIATLIVCQDNFISYFPVLPNYIAAGITEILIYNTYITCLPFAAGDYTSLVKLGESLNPYFDCNCLQSWKETLPHVIFDSDCFTPITEITRPVFSDIVSTEETTNQAFTVATTTDTWTYNQSLISTTTQITDATTVNVTTHSPDEAQETRLWIVVSGTILTLICIFIGGACLLIWYRRGRRRVQPPSPPMVSYRMQRIYRPTVVEGCVTEDTVC